ncbi:MAG: pyridoxamine 5'-phosphate oxidase [bacterium]|nr:pyridoxamine 5'-phosphate oxidase [bacterium]
MLPPLDLESLSADPVEQFGVWFRDARDCDLKFPDAVALATADAAGRPSARMVLLKKFDETGFLFSTNYESRKATELQSNPNAALLFYWEPLNRQVRIEGRVERASAEESDAIHLARPRASRLSAWASPQSRPVVDRARLETRVRELDRIFADEEVPRPDFWGAYRLIPERFEFWQSRDNRLHDRVDYSAEDGRWIRSLLGP